MIPSPANPSTPMIIKMKIEKYARRIFVRQLTDNDCGTACLKMILNYTNSPQECNMVADSDLSLLELKNLASKYRLSSKCVVMDAGFLKTNKVPCILHLLNESGRLHYVVCLGCRNSKEQTRFLVADPAHDIYYLSEDKLNERWASRAALFFTHLEPTPSVYARPVWQELLTSAFLPSIIWFVIPFFSVVLAMFSVAISWVLQKGMDNPYTNQKASVVSAILVLLLIITVFKAVLFYLKQHIHVLMNKGIYTKLFQGVFTHIDLLKASLVPYNQVYVRNLFGDLQKVQNGLQVMVSVILSDGAIFVVLLLLMACELPAAVIFELPFLIISVYSTLSKADEFSAGQHKLLLLAGDLEHTIRKTADQKAQKTDKSDRPPYDRYLKLLQALNVKANKQNLLFDSLGAVTVVAVLAYALSGVAKGNITYGELMTVVFASYFATTLCARICHASYAVMEAGYALRTLKNSGAC